MRIVIAPDSFKGSATAAQVAAAIGQGWAQVRPADDIRAAPMADGGEGTLDAFAASSPGSRSVPVSVTGPDDQIVDTHYLQLPDGTAVVELASTSGIGLTDRKSPMTAHSRGFGACIAAALEDGATRLVLAIGGSGCTDGGVGALSELGGRFLTAGGIDIGSGGGALAGLDRVDLTGLRPLPRDGAVVLSDVTSPLFGAMGAAHVFGAQKGAAARQRDELDAGLRQLAKVLAFDPTSPGAGAAGGTGYALLAWGAQVTSGAAAVAEATGLADLLQDSDLVITGEGRFDAQSGYGKVASHVLSEAGRRGCPVGLVAGTITAPATAFAAAVSLVELAGSVEASMADPLSYCRSAGRLLAERLARRSTAGPTILG